jgi:hypothetical protein
MDKRKAGKLLRREMGVWLKLSPWVLVSLLLAALLWRTDIAAVSGLFQSPQTPTATQPPTVFPTELPTETPTELPTEAPTQVPTEVPTQTPLAIPTNTSVPTGTVAPASATSVFSPTVELEATPAGSERYPAEDTSLKFDWGVLFDSLALGISYVWLCCGVLLFVTIPVVFVILWVVSKRRQEQEQ